VKAIRKSDEPACLARHRAESGSYGTLRSDDKQALRVALVAEQAGLCCYCMRGIRPNESLMKVEHWRCQSDPDHAHLQLVYSNLLGACLGGTGQPPEGQHCDTRKGKSPLKWSPAEHGPSVEALVRYEVDGTIRSDDPVFDRQIGPEAGQGVLNLNVATLKAARKAVLDEVASWLRRERERRRGPVPKSVIEHRLTKLTEGALLQPFCGVAIWALRQRLPKTR
jgi:uncharacterized protein (TIGR02646 family)